jgi:hypothetical protein
MITIFKQYLNESVNFDKLLDIAKGVDYDTFLDKTDALSYFYYILYRGSENDDSLENDIFMTDWIGHARSYGEEVEAIIINKKDVLYFHGNGMFYEDDVINILRK